MMKPQTKCFLVMFFYLFLILTGNMLFWTFLDNPFLSIVGLVFGGALLGYIVGDWATMKLERGDFEK